jgi:hypothetical protein
VARTGASARAIAMLKEVAGYVFDRAGRTHHVVARSGHCKEEKRMTTTRTRAFPGHPCLPSRQRRLGAPAVAALAIGALLFARQAVGADNPVKPIPIDDSSFKCITEMKAVRHFYVDNLLGDVAQTLAVAEKGSGDFPVGSVLQLVPNEVMVKQPKGFSPATRDWEFFFIDVSEQGSKIYRRGFAEVNNRFGGNCFACHVKAKPDFDFVCEQGHGCDPVPFTRPMFGALQRTDPRCKNRAPVSAEDAAALQQLGELVKSLPVSNKTN